MSDKPDEYDFSIYLSGTMSTAEDKPLTLEDLEKFFKAIESIPSEPIGAWMRKRGYSPELWVLVLPQRLRDSLQAACPTPKYVKFSDRIDIAVFIRQEALDDFMSFFI